MAEQRVVVRIGTDGKISFDVDGCTGTSCEDLTNQLSKGLGKVEERTVKNEYYEGERPDYVENQNGGE